MATFSNLINMQDIPLSTDIVTQSELDTNIEELSTGLIGTNEDAASANTINGSKKYAKEYTNGAIDTVISGAPAAFDTLKEIADWILSDQTSSTKLISDIIDLQKDVGKVSSELSNYLPLSGGALTGPNGLSIEEAGFYAAGYGNGCGLSIGNGPNDGLIGIIIDGGGATDSTISGFTNLKIDSGVGVGLTVENNNHTVTINGTNSYRAELYGVGEFDANSYGYGGGLSVGQGGTVYGCYVNADHLTAPGMVAEVIDTGYSGLSVTAVKFGDGTYISSSNDFAAKGVYLPLSGGIISSTDGNYNAAILVLSSSIGETNAAPYILLSNQIGSSYSEGILQCGKKTNDEYSDSVYNGITLSSGGNLLIKAPNGFYDGVIDGIKIESNHINLDTLNGDFELNNVKNIWINGNPLIRLGSLSVNFPGDSGRLVIDSEIPLSVSQLSNDSGYITEQSLSGLSDIYALSDEVVEGLSNVVVPKLSTIADLISAEVERVDEISGKLSNAVTESDLAEYLPLSGGTVTGNVELSSSNLTFSKRIDSEYRTRTATLGFDGNAVTLSSYPSSNVNINMELKNNETLFNNLSVIKTAVVNNHTNDKFIANGRSNIVNGYAVAINGDISAISGYSGHIGNGIAINATVSGNNSVAIGGNHFSDCSLFGNNSTLINSTIGNPSLSGNDSVTIGNSFLMGNNSIAINNNMLIGNKSIGILGKVSADYAIQLGDNLTAYTWNGNTEASSFNVFQYKMLNKDGLIPDARLCSNIVRKSDISDFVTENGLSNYLKLTGGTMDGPIYSGENTGLGLKNSVLVAGNSNARLCATYAVHGDEEYLLNNAEEGKTILLTIDSLFPYTIDNGTITPADLSVLGGLHVGTYELSFTSDPDYEDVSDQGLVWEYRLSDENNNFGIFIAKEDYPGIAEVYKYFSLDINSKLKVPGDEDLDLWFMESETLDLEHKKIPYGEVSPLVSKKYVDGMLSNVVDLTSNQAITGEKFFIGHDVFVENADASLQGWYGTSDITFYKNHYGTAQISSDENLGLVLGSGNSVNLFILPDEIITNVPRKLVAEDQLSGYVPLSDYQILANRLSTLESRLSDIETIVDQINGTN